MSRGYGKHRKNTNCQTNLQFDKLLKENSNCPSAARSTGTVGKWGITSFTSIRAANGLAQQHKAEKPVPEVAKPKKFFKSRNKGGDSKAAHVEETQSFGEVGGAEQGFGFEREAPRKHRKFFRSKNNAEKSVLAANVNTNPKRDEGKPPIVLRICRGRSQLLSDSDESESTPTPSSTPSTSTITSPRALRESAQRTPGNIRITRSARRSMQQDPSSSPVSADTPADAFDSLFMSPKDDDEDLASPQYIPAEKYELERKAMYDSLLRPDSPKECASAATTPQEAVEDKTSECIAPVLEEMEKSPIHDEEEYVQVPEEIAQQPVEEETLAEETSDIVDVPEAVPEVKEPREKPAVHKTPEKKSSPSQRKKKLAEEWATDSEESDEPAPKLRRRRRSSAKSEAKVNPVEVHQDEILDKILEQPESTAVTAPVKLIISKKKGSIFKSRQMVSDGTKKRRALYKHKWSDETRDAQPKLETDASKADEYGFPDDALTRVTKEGASDDETPITSVKCSKSDKNFYTVVRNVKKAHQMQEIGEFQEFNDDVEYILDALQDNNPISTRCLSAITLASKCMVPAFRMHVRAHGTVAKFFKALHDANKDQSLGLCTATVMFVLSQDRLNMDLDRDCLELMLSLLESDVSYQHALDVCGLSSSQLEKNKQKVRELCGEIQSQGHAKHINLDNITVGQLAMETLLSLTSKRAGEWFKEELRELGGLEHIIKTINECCRQVSDYVITWTDVLLDKLRKIDRCMRVLENVTHNNEENQVYILKYNDGMILETLVKLYRLCDAELPLYPVNNIADKDSTGTVIREALLVTLKVLINLTHHFGKDSVGSALVGSRPGIVDASLHLLLQVPHYIPDQKKFELGVLVLMLLINLIQDNDTNKQLLVDARAPAEFESAFTCDKSAVEALIEQFYKWEEFARLAERKTDAILDGEKDADGDKPQPKSNEEFIEETVAKLLQKAGIHMEFTFLASYIVMLVGFLIMNGNEYIKVVKPFLKDHNFTVMVEMLKKFFNFMNLTASAGASSVCAMKATEKVLKYLEDCDKSAYVDGAPSTLYTPESMDFSYSQHITS